MSEVETAAVESVPVAPTATPEPIVTPPVVTSVETPPEVFKSMADVKRSGREGAREIADRRETERRDKANRLRNPDGTFASAEATEPTTAESVPEFPADMSVEVEPALEAVEVAAEPEASSELPDGWVTIELEEGHPLRQDRGTESIAVPEHLANDLRYALKQGVRNRELTELRTNLSEAERFAIAAQAEAQYYKAQIASPVAEGDLEAIKADILQAYPGKLGEVMWEGFQSKISGEDTSGADAAKQEALHEVETQRVLQEGEKFVNLTMRDALVGLDGRPPRFPGWSQAGVAQALKIYGMFLKSEGRPNMDGAEFVREFAMPMYLRSAEGKRYGQAAATKLQQQQVDSARTEGQKQAEKTHQAELKEAAERHRTNPTARLPLNAGLAARSADPAQEVDDNKGLDRGALRKKLRGEVGDLARR